MDVRPRTTRLPPGQVVTKKWPVLHYGLIPMIEPDQWRFRVFGLVDQPFELDYHELRAMPQSESLCDIHCVTRWSRFDNLFSGVAVSDILARARVRPAARFVIVHAAPDYTTNLPLDDLDRPGNLLATHHSGEPLPPEHGGPVRLLVPHLYLWKSAKWVRGLDLMVGDRPGFWESAGYHNYGDPWQEQRYWGD